MSTFCGRMKEYSEISIDRFNGDNLNSTVFFLSHCHRDHMVGLSHTAFAERLQSSNDIFLYMTDVSKVLLMGDNTYNFHHLEPYIKTLQIKRSSTITILCNTVSGQPKLVSVTLLPAGHCPGSVMFLFEGNEGTVLYTGDFRWEKDKAASLSQLHNELGIKPIKSLYIDTTFCIPNALHFPSRYQCVEVTVQLVKTWLSNSKSHFVYIASPMNYGHEHLQVEIFKHTNEPIHTSDWKYSIYKQIQDLAMAYTTDPSARIHACGLKKKFNSKSFLPCGHLFDTEDEEAKLLVVRPSTMWFTMSTIRSEKLVEGPSKSSDPHRVCYSLHSSYSEIKNFVSYLNPDQVFPNVIPAQEPNSMLVQARLNSFLKPRDISLNQEPPNYSLGNLNVKLSVKRIRSPSLSSSDDLMFDSPVKRPKTSYLKSEAAVKDLDEILIGYEPKATKLDSLSESLKFHGDESDSHEEHTQNDKTRISPDLSNHQIVVPSNQNSSSPKNNHRDSPYSSPTKKNSQSNFPSSSPTDSKCDSSYQGSDASGSELDLFNSPIKNQVNESPIGDKLSSYETLLQRDDEKIRSWEEEDEAFRLYISSDDSDIDDDQTVSKTLDPNIECVNGNLDGQNEEHTCDKDSQNGHSESLKLPFVNSSCNESPILNVSVNDKPVHDFSVNDIRDQTVTSGDISVNKKTDLEAGNGITDRNDNNCSVLGISNHTATVGDSSVNGDVISLSNVTAHDHSVTVITENTISDVTAGACSVKSFIDLDVGDCSVNSDTISVIKPCESQLLNCSRNSNLLTLSQQNSNSNLVNVNDQNSANNIGRNKTKTTSKQSDVIIINQDMDQSNGENDKLHEEGYKLEPGSPILFKSKTTPNNQLSPPNDIDSDSDATLPPSQNMLLPHYDSDSDVEILYEDRVENDYTGQDELLLVLDRSPDTKSNHDNFIDLTEESQSF